ncbi:MAG: 23S rRNA (uridine2552-2'-O)-methyltransferase [Polyangiales bacterium]
MGRHRRSRGGGRGGQDIYTKKALKEGYPARSVYKLEEIDRRVGLFRRGMKVLDLGASPGSWTLYAAKMVGPAGSVLGIDLQEQRTGLPPHASFRIGDMYDETVESLGGPFDVVISDMAPDTSGQRDADMYRSYELVLGALRLAEGTLLPGGSFVAKIFQGGEYEDARAEIRKSFTKVRTLRPKATKDISYEVYLVGIGFKPKPPPSGDPLEETLQSPLSKADESE